jgi:hypothetical protein
VTEPQEWAVCFLTAGVVVLFLPKWVSALVWILMLCLVTSACIVDGGYGHEHHHYGWWH